MQVVLASESPQQREQVRRTVLGVGLRCESADCVDFAGLPLRLARGNVDLVLVGMEQGRKRALPAIAEALRYSDRPILAIGPATNTERVVEVLRSGAREYLDQEHVQDELIDAIDRLRRAGVVENRQGKVVGLLSATAGTGVTTLSAGLAFALAQQKAGEVLLAEVGSGSPEFALQLNLQPSYTLRMLLRDWDRVDATVLRQTLVGHPLGVQVLCAHTTGLTPPAVPAATMRQLLALSRNLFDHGVFDLGHGLTEAAVESLQHLDEVYLVTRLEVPALSLTKRLINVLTQQHNVPPERLQLVGNRGNQRGQLTRRQVEEILGYQLLGVVADEPATAIQAQNEGRALQEVAPRGKMCRTLAEMAKRLATTPA